MPCCCCLIPWTRPEVIEKLFASVWVMINELPLYEGESFFYLCYRSGKEVAHQLSA